ncbi:hypothetical protein [Pseudomonas sp.]|uniref:hypothetical protein n=1 Tax=Pseudomonas sp. TaxID=306 RepID=UPI0028ADC287|nr:hypothetical protein [Pseudomonas sp.]
MTAPWDDLAQGNKDCQTLPLADSRLPNVLPAWLTAVGDVLVSLTVALEMAWHAS